MRPRSTLGERVWGRDRIHFLQGVPDRLVVLGPLLRPLIELHWTRDVARWSGVATEGERLRAHLFGADRVSFPSAGWHRTTAGRHMPLLRGTAHACRAGRSLYRMVAVAERRCREPC